MLQFLHISDRSINMYDIINDISAFVLIFYVFIRVKAFAALSSYCAGKKRPVLWGFLLLLLIYAVFSGLFFFLNSKFGDWFTNKNKNYYGTLTAWFTAFTFIPILLKISPLKTLDLFSGGLPLQLFIAKLACFCWGCCYSFEMRGSFYFSLYNHRYEFPIQLLEALVALILFVFLIRYKKHSYKTGTVFPIYLILYSISRFLTEFLRADLPKIAKPFDAYQIMSIIFTLFGFAFLWIVRKKRNAIEAHFNHS